MLYATIRRTRHTQATYEIEGLGLSQSYLDYTKKEAKALFRQRLDQKYGMRVPVKFIDETKSTADD